MDLRNILICNEFQLKLIRKHNVAVACQQCHSVGLLWWIENTTNRRKIYKCSIAAAGRSMIATSLLTTNFDFPKIIWNYIIPRDYFWEIWEIVFWKIVCVLHSYYIMVLVHNKTRDAIAWVERIFSIEFLHKMNVLMVWCCW